MKVSKTKEMAMLLERVAISEYSIEADCININLNAQQIWYRLNARPQVPSKARDEITKDLPPTE